MKALVLKAIGNKEAIETFIKFLEEEFTLVSVGLVRKNDRDSDLHCFIDLDVFHRRHDKPGS